MKKAGIITKKQNKSTRKTGLPPGSIVYTGFKNPENSQVKVLRFNEDYFFEQNYNFDDDVLSYKTEEDKVNWIHFTALNDTRYIEKIGKEFGLHSLVLEDITNIEQRPKYSDYGDYLFLTLKNLQYNSNEKELDSDHISLILLKNMVISFSETNTDIFSIIYERIKQKQGKLRHKTADYLFYAILDVIVDHYYLAVEQIGNEIDDIEESIMNNPSDSVQLIIQNNKRNLLALRKAIFPLRDELGRLFRNDSELVDSKTNKYINDVFDHSIQIIETIESYREINSGLMDLYLSGINLRMNQVIQVLTIISTIFIPLTFIVGLYGMNFDNMPELHFKYGYFVVLSIMAAIALSLVKYFTRKKWL